MKQKHRITPSPIVYPWVRSISVPSRYDLQRILQTSFDCSFQIGIGVMVELLSLIPSLFIVQFFRRIRSRQPPTLLPNHPERRKKGSPLTFPWWCLFLAYTLSFLILIISIFFIVVRGIELGDLQTQKWLTSIVTGFFSSIFLTQPIKIVCLAIFLICFCRSTNEEKEEVDINQFEVDQEDLQTIEVCWRMKVDLILL